MFSTKAGRAWVLYLLVTLAVLLIVLASEHVSWSSQRLDWTIIAIGLSLYVVAYAIVLPFWNLRAKSRSADTMVADPPGRFGETSHDHALRLAAVVTMIVLAGVFTWGPIRMGAKFGESELRDSSLVLIPALVSFLVAVASLVMPFRDAEEKSFTRWLRFLCWAMLLVCIVFGVLIAPAVALLSWESYSFDAYREAVKPAWLAVPVVALTIRLLLQRKRTNR